MLKNNLLGRFTAKWWDDRKVDESDLQYILECAYLAPSKQGRYNFNIYVFGDDDRSQNFKRWLYYENTYCLDKVRGKTGEGLKRYNGQVLAPIVLLWVAHDNGHETRDDCLISASVAMCASLEKNLQTGLTGCIGPEEIAAKLSISTVPITCLGIGYAEPDMMLTRPVFLDGKKIGFDLSNTDPKIVENYNRSKKPKFSDLIIFYN